MKPKPYLLFAFIGLSLIFVACQPLPADVESRLVELDQVLTVRQTETAESESVVAQRAESTPTPTTTATSTPIPEPTSTPTATLEPTPAPIVTSPTETSTPEPEPAPILAVPMVSAVDSNVNLRSGPGTNFERVGVLLQGDSLEIIGRNEDSSWWQVLTEDDVSWIAASVTEASNINDSIPVVTLAPQTIEQSGPSAVERFEQGLAYFDAENWDAAKAEFVAVTEMEPDFAPGHQLLGFTQYLTEDFEGAKASLERYLQLEPDSDDKDRIVNLIAEIDSLSNTYVTPLGVQVDIPEDKGLVVVVNYTADPVVVDIAGQAYEIDGKNRNPNGGEVFVEIWPGRHVISANAMDGSAAGRAEFDIAAGQVLEWPLYYNP
ncbi:MAG: SH3 domain-containing protein [Chloroflexota bacterium]